MNKRDTKFAGFAKAVVQECMSVHDGAMDASDWWQEQAQKIIAQRAYDLAFHVMSSTSVGLAAENEGGELSRKENMRYIPDMTEWPEVSK